MCKRCLCFREGKPRSGTYRSTAKGEEQTIQAKRVQSDRQPGPQKVLSGDGAFSCSCCEVSQRTAAQCCPVLPRPFRHLSRRWIDAWLCCASCLWASSWPRSSSCSRALSCRSLCEARSSCRYPVSCSRSLATSSWEDSSLRRSSCRGHGTHSEHQQPSRAPRFFQKGPLAHEVPSQDVELRGRLHRDPATNTHQGRLWKVPTPSWARFVTPVALWAMATHLLPLLMPLNGCLHGLQCRVQAGWRAGPCWGQMPVG